MSKVNSKKTNTKKRKNLTKKTRFEVFKRDSFTCQYCGNAAPNVVLEVDHIKAVANGGDNGLINLITSCFSCNRGKGARKLDDNTVVEKQRQQLEELNERRIQLEMIMDWRRDVEDIDKITVDMICEAISTKSQLSPNDSGKRDIRKWLKRYSFDEILDAIDSSFSQYLDWDNDEEATSESWNKAFDYVPRISSVKRRTKEKPYLRELYYIRGILRNRVYVNESYIMDLLEDAVSYDADLEGVKYLAKTCNNWTQFKEKVEDYICVMKERSEQ
ncbi:HNH endonuclease [Kiloniella antarctica]|uniref:HNH endonuclease n=1 Tax=Kiloniella antarctica TaxID=1550907 RepID=A0ABW5BNW8_9PROT